MGIELNKHAKRASKAKAFESMLKLKRGGELNQVELDSLVLYFAPSRPAKPKTGFEWVSKAAGVKDVRYYLNNVYVSGNDIVATDGHRLHIVENEHNLLDGYYNARTGIKTDEDHRFPDYKRVIPEIPRQDMIHNHELIPYVSEKGQHLYKIGEGYFDQKYVNDALCDKDAVSIRAYVTMDRLTGYSEFGQYVVMGVRV